MKMVTTEFLSLENLSKAQTLCIHKSTEVIVIDKYKNIILRLFYIVSLSLKNLNNS